MRNLALKSVFTLLSVVAFAFTSHAGGVTNNFDTPFNYLANGVIGDTNWDGVYLGFGDIPNGGAGGSGNGATTIADAAITVPGPFMAVRTTRGDWSGAGDDGFFLYKVVSGDFDLSVQSSPPWTVVANHFGGLLVRAWNTNNSGAPVSFVGATPTENWLALFRCQQFGAGGIDEIRQATNNANFENTFPDITASTATTGTNDLRYYRITRTGNTFSFYWRSNTVDSWVLITNAGAGGGYIPAAGSVTRDDWAGQPVQVGIAEAMFSTGAATSFYTDFQLTGPNVGFGGTPPADPTNIVATVTSSNAVTLTWEPGAGSAGSLVLIRNGAIPNRVKPVPGLTYTGNTNFQSTANFFGGGARIVYAGTDTNVTITGLSGSNNTYYAAVYSYTGAGPAITYGLSPATNSFAGPGIPQLLTVGISLTNLPVGGATPLTAIITYSSGDSVNVTTDPTIVYGSTDPSVIVTALNGAATALTNGTASVYATYAGITSTNGPVTVHTPAFIDGFNVAHNYASNGVPGSMWDGVYLGFGDIPWQVTGNGGAVPGTTPVMDANITSNALFMRYSQTGFEGNESDGNFLWKVAQGDFQAAVHIQAYQPLAFNFVGLMARQFTNDGGPFGTTNTTFTHGRENHTRWTRFDEFGISTSSRQNINGGNTARDQVDGENNNFWLLMVRSNTTFLFFKRVNPTDAWAPVTAATATIAASAGQPMQVGISASCFANNNRTAQFDFFMLDATNIVPYVSPPAASAPELTAFTNSTITLTWSNGTGSAGSIVVMRAGRPVNVQPVNGVTYVDSPTFGQGSNLGSSNYVVYVGTGTSVTVSNLIPGIVYHAAVFSYSGAGASTLYNTTEAQASSVTAQGQISKIYVRLPSGTNVLNQGAAFYTVDVVYTSAVTNDVTGTAVLFFDPPTAAAYNTNGLGIFTPMTNIPFNVYAVFSTSSGLNATNTDLATVTTHEPVLIDNFDVNHDYLATGVGGTIFDGVYFGDVANHPSNSIPGGVGTTSPGLGLTTIADANVSSNGYLTVQHSGTGWEFAEDDGFLLLKNISGNFQASVHVFEATDGFFPPTANANVGLMARAAGAAGGPFGGAGEDWISWSRFDLFGIQNDGRSTLDGGTTRLEVRDGTTNYWLMIVRNGNTFYFMERPTTNDAWFVRNNFTTVRSDFGGQPLQVGIQAAMFAAATGKTLFDHFALDGTANRPILAHARSGGNLTLSWSTAYAAYTLQSSSSVLPGSATWSSVATAPVITNGLINVTVPTSSAAAFYRLVR